MLDRRVRYFDIFDCLGGTNIACDDSNEKIFAQRREEGGALFKLTLEPLRTIQSLLMFYTYIYMYMRDNKKFRLFCR